jgi:hypothetical protein
VVNSEQILFANERMLDSIEAPAQKRPVRSTGARETARAWPKLKEVGSWMQDTCIESGWATFPGMTAPDRGVAQAGANLLTALLG